MTQAYRLSTNFKTISEKMEHWYLLNKRDLPWRNSQNPYHIWLSEIILQQTRVAQGMPYYLNFIKQYPKIQDLALAPEEDVLRLWQGLGYYSRARNLHQTAKFVSQKLDGVFPNKYQDLLKLKGVGTYTAAAIASFAYNEQVAVLDGNVFRVLARIFGIDTDIASNEGKKEFTELATLLLPQQNAQIHNQAIMEFGALQCTPQKPNCDCCPLADICIAKQSNLQSILPVKINKTKIKNRYFNYFLIESENKILMQKRNNDDIWAGLYEPFLLETETENNDEMLLETVFLKEICKNGLIISVSETIKHILTHRRILAKFWHIKVNNVVDTPTGYNFYTKPKIEALPKPILIAKYFNFLNL